MFFCYSEIRDSIAKVGGGKVSQIKLSREREGEREREKREGKEFHHKGIWA